MTVYINGVAEVGVTTHAALTDVSTPHVLADLEDAVCSEDEADEKVSSVKLFFSETDDLSDITYTHTRKNCTAESWTTLFDIPSGGCRFLGGLVGSRSEEPFAQVRITVDGGAPQTISSTYLDECPFILPPILVNTSILVEFYNGEETATGIGVNYWRKPL